MRAAILSILSGYLIKPKSCIFQGKCGAHWPTNLEIRFYANLKYLPHYRAKEYICFNVITRGVLFVLSPPSGGMRIL